MTNDINTEVVPDLTWSNSERLDIDFENYTAFDPEAELAEQQREYELFLKRLNRDASCDPTAARSARGEALWVGFDAEWISNPDGPGNLILSIQLYAVIDGQSLGLVFYAKGDARPSLRKSLLKLISVAIERGLLYEWPSEIVLVGFFLRIDLAALSDVDHLRHQVDCVAGRIGTVGADAQLPVDPEDLAEVMRSQTVLTYDGLTPTLLKLRFIDIASHAPVGSSLADLGESIDLKKLALPEGHSIERMDVLLRQDRNAFEAYGLRDAEIAVRYALHLQGFVETHIGSSRLPATASGVAMALLRQVLIDADIDPATAFGTHQVSTEAWDTKSNKVRTITTTEPVPLRRICETFVTECYHGGRNECFTMGPTAMGDWNDFDLAGAYTTGLTDLKLIDFNHPKPSLHVADFLGDVAGCALVEFEHPPEVRYPVLPVRMGKHGLVYPVAGESWCTAPEIQAAHDLGCKLNIRWGVVYPWASEIRLFESFVKEVRRLRSSFAKGSPQEVYAKLIGNALYGKTAQGLRPKTVFDTRKTVSVKLPPSPITNPLIAAHATGFIRGLLGELLNRIPGHRTVVSVTTDGFLTDATEAELDLTGPLAQRFQALCELVKPGSTMLERKHRVQQVVAMKTRGQLSGALFDDEPPVLAKAGVQPPKPCNDPNRYMLDLYLQRQPGQMTLSMPFVSLRDQWTTGSDVYRLVRESRLSLEFDMKRKPVDPQMATVGDPGVGPLRAHLALSTVPWQTVAEAMKTRALFDGWRRNHCLKTLDDWHDWQGALTHGKARRARRDSGQPVMNQSDRGHVDTLRRAFLRVYTQGALGIVGDRRYADLAAWLTELGHDTTVYEVKNAKRARLVEGQVPRTMEVMALLELLSAAYPTADLDRLLVPDETRTSLVDVNRRDEDPLLRLAA